MNRNSDEDSTIRNKVNCWSQSYLCDLTLQLRYSEVAVNSQNPLE